VGGSIPPTSKAFFEDGVPVSVCDYHACHRKVGAAC
jgi:hypothetical protein